MFFEVNFRVSIVPAGNHPLSFVSDYEGDVLIYRDDGATRRAGKARLFVIHADAAIASKMSLDEVLDVSSAIAPYTALLSNTEAGNFSPAVMGILGGEFVMSRDMIILDRLEILPKFRGQKLGLGVMQACLDRFAGRSRIAAIKPYPLQFEPRSETSPWATRMDLASIKGSQRAATARLKKYYSQVGFVPVSGTDLMTRDLYKTAPES